MIKINILYNKCVEYYNDLVNSKEKIKELEKEKIKEEELLKNKLLEKEKEKNNIIKNKYVKLIDANIKECDNTLVNELLKLIEKDDCNIANLKSILKDDYNSLNYYLKRLKRDYNYRITRLNEKIDYINKEYNIIDNKDLLDEEEYKNYYNLINKKEEYEKNYKKLLDGYYDNYYSSLHNSEFLRGASNISNFHNIVLSYKKIRDRKIPYFVDYKDFSIVFLNKNNENNIHNLIISYILKVYYSVDTFNIKFNLVDDNNGKDYLKLIELIKIDSDVIHGNLLIDKNTALKKINELIIERNSILGTEDFIDYNNKNFNKIDREVFIIENFIDVFKNNKDVLDKLIEQGNRCGISYILIDNYNKKGVDEKDNLAIKEILNSINYVLKYIVINEKTYVIENNNKIDTFATIKDVDIETLDLYLNNALKYKEEKLINIREEYKVDINTILNNVNRDKDTINEINLPLGMSPKKEVIYLDIGSNAPHTLLIGMTGSGKSNLYHEIVLSSMLMYDKEELEFYIMDLKAGMGFGEYSRYNASNIKQILITDNLCKINITLKYLCDEIERRSELFRKVGNNVDNYRLYRKYAKLPRIVLLIDEFQTIFNDNSLSGLNENSKSKSYIERLIMQGNAAGIHVIMSSQVYNGNGLSNNVLSQLVNRIVLKSDRTISTSLLDIDKEMQEKIELFNSGEGIVNNNLGNKKSNRLFITPFIKDEDKIKLLKKISSFNNEDSKPVLIESKLLSEKDFEYTFINSKKFFTKMHNPVILFGEQASLEDKLFYKVFDRNYNNNFYIGIKNRYKRECLYNSIIKSLELWKNNNNLVINIFDLTGKNNIITKLNTRYIDLSNNVDLEIFNNFIKEIDNNKININFIYGYNMMKVLDEDIYRIIDDLYINGYKNNIYSIMFMDYNNNLRNPKLINTMEVTNNFIYDKEFDDSNKENRNEITYHNSSDEVTIITLYDKGK